MAHMFQLTIKIMIFLQCTDSLFCPVGYKLVNNNTVEDSVNLTWSDAAMEYNRRNGTMVLVNDNQSEQNIKDTRKKSSLDKTRLQYMYIDNKTPEDTGDPYYIMEYVRDAQLNASSIHDFIYRGNYNNNTYYYPAEYAKINSKHAWVPHSTEVGEWVQVDLRKTMCIHGIVTKGLNSQRYTWWTKTYKLYYSKDGDDFLALQDRKDKLLSANTDRNTPVYRNFTKLFNAQFVRLYPQTWHSWPAIRFDLLVSDDRCPKNPGESHGIQPGSNPDTLNVGFLSGMIIFIIISIVLLILLICSYCKKHVSKEDSNATNLNNYINKSEVNQNVAMVTPNIHSAELKDLYSEVDLKTKGPKVKVVYGNIETYDATYVNMAEAKDNAAYESTDAAVHNVTNNADNAADIAVYHTAEDVDIEKVDDSEIPDGIEMMNNEIYADD